MELESRILEIIQEYVLSTLSGWMNFEEKMP